MRKWKCGKKTVGLWLIFSMAASSVAFLAFNAFGDGINNSLPSGQRAAFTNMTGVYR